MSELDRLIDWCDERFLRAATARFQAEYRISVFVDVAVDRIAAHRKRMLEKLKELVKEQGGRQVPGSAVDATNAIEQFCRALHGGEGWVIG